MKVSFLVRSCLTWGTDSFTDMFRAILSSKLKNEGVFSCLVAKDAKPSLAYYRTPEPTDLVNAIAQLSEI